VTIYNRDALVVQGVEDVTATRCHTQLTVSSDCNTLQHRIVTLQRNSVSKTYRIYIYMYMSIYIYIYIYIYVYIHRRIHINIYVYMYRCIHINSIHVYITSHTSYTCMYYIVACLCIYHILYI